MLQYRGQLPWLIIKNEERLEYFNALEKAQADSDILPFMHFIAKKTSTSVSLDDCKIYKCFA